MNVTVNARRSKRRTAMRWRVVALVFLLAFITIVDRVCISSAKLRISADLRITDVQFGWVFGAFALGYAILMIPAGWLADRIGPRLFLATLVCAWSLLTAGTGFVTGLTSLLIVRLLFGLAEAGVYPTASRAIYSWMPKPERGLAFGLLNAGSRLGAALGLAIASYLILLFGWRTCFWLLGAVGVFWAAKWYAWYRDDPAQKSGIYADELNYIEGGKDAEPRFSESKYPWKALVFSPSGYALLLQYFSNNFSLFLVYSWMLPYLERRFQMEPGKAGVFSGMPMYCGVVATSAGGVAVDFLLRRGRGSWSRAIPAIAGFALASVGEISAAAAITPGWFVIWFGVVVFGLDFTVSSSWTVCSDLGGEHTGTVSGAMNMMGSLGSFACSLAFPYALRLTGHAQAFFWLAATLNFIALACWFVLGRRLRSTRIST